MYPAKTHLLLVVLLVSELLLSGHLTTAAQSNPTTPNPAASNPQLDHFDVSQIDRNLDPCVDFYQYTCRNWIARNPIPPDQANWWLGAKLMIWNQTVVRQILESASSDDRKRSPAEQKIGDYYASCMDENEINHRGVTPLKPELDRIAALHAMTQVPEELAHLHGITFSLATSTAVFGFGSGQDFDDASKVVAVVDQSGLGLPDRDYYLKPDQKSAALRQQYVEHIRKTFELLGEPSAQAAEDAKVVMDLETSLAKVSLDQVKRRDPANLNHKLSFQQLQALTPAFSWDEYLKHVHAPVADRYLVMTPDFFKGVDQLMTSVPLANWKTYLRWQLVNWSSSLLSQPFVDGRFDYFSHTLLGQKAQAPRWRRCVRNVDRDLAEALGQEYVARVFAADSKERMLKLVHALEAALSTDIQQVDWMSPATKKAALAKLASIDNKIGYPDHWRDYSSLEIVRGDALGNAFRSSEFEMKRQLTKIGKPVDRAEWIVSPSVPNAGYDPQSNSIIFPAAILQPPLFDRQADDAANFAAIGAIIGHEMTHGFDDQGRKFDGDGNLHDWWSVEDGKAFDERAQCIADEYSGFEATEGVKLNGKLTLGENTADNGGLRIALMALESTLSSQVPTRVGAAELTPQQRFFIAYGESWCSNATPQYQRMLAQSDPHSTPTARVNGVVSNMPEFQKAFGCKKGQPMVRENACRVW